MIFLHTEVYCEMIEVEIEPFHIRLLYEEIHRIMYKINMASDLFVILADQNFENKAVQSFD